MKIVSIAGICIIASIMCKFFESAGKEYALYIKIVAAALVMSMTILFVSPIAESIRNIFSKAGSEEEYLTILFKALGICYITQFACDICKDSGENALATQAELAGKVSLLILALPLFEALVGIVENLI